MSTMFHLAGRTANESYANPFGPRNTSSVIYRQGDDRSVTVACKK